MDLDDIYQTLEKKLVDLEATEKEIQAYSQKAKKKGNFIDYENPTLRTLIQRHRTLSDHIQPLTLEEIRGYRTFLVEETKKRNTRESKKELLKLAKKFCDPPTYRTIREIVESVYKR